MILLINQKSLCTLIGIKPVHFLSKDITWVTEVIYFWQTDSFFFISIKIFIDKFGNINCLFLSYPIFHYSNYLIESDSFLIIDSLKEDLNIINNILFENCMINLTVHCNKTLEIDFLLLFKYLFKSLRTNCYFIHIKHYLKSFLEFLYWLLWISQ